MLINFLIYASIYTYIDLIYGHYNYAKEIWLITMKKM